MKASNFVLFKFLNISRSAHGPLALVSVHLWNWSYASRGWDSGRDFPTALGYGSELKRSWVSAPSFIMGLLAGRPPPPFFSFSLIERKKEMQRNLIYIANILRKRQATTF